MSDDNKKIPDFCNKPEMLSEVAIQTIATATEKQLWYQLILTRKMLICIFTGFTSGLPLYFLLQLIPA